MPTGLLQGVKEVEAAREEIKHPSFLTQLFAGEPDFRLLAPFPRPDGTDQAIGDEFCARVAEFLAQRVDPASIERTGRIPREVLAGLAELGCFGMKIPREYGGLGFSQVNYNRVLELVGGYCNTLALLLSAHQSIGVSRPILLFGTEEQKRKWLPRIASGAISAFGFTEPQVGSDPANMTTFAVLSDDGQHYLVNGEKLWCTNGTIAEIIVLMAKVKGKITPFIVEMNSPGIEVLHRCEFMGCRGIENAWIRFTNVKVPAENVIGEVGKGLKVALTTLNTGRISLAALCLGIAKQVAAPAIQWANTRETFGKKIGHHELNTHKVAHLAADIFAMEAVTYLVSGMIDRAHTDFRVESAVAKLFCSEKLWSLVDTAMQIRGGRGYEKADSLQARGEQPIPIEQLMRDARLYLIGEGSSEILKLFIAREVWDPHLKRATGWFNERGPAKLVEGTRLASFYAKWYARQVLPEKDGDSLDHAIEDPTLRSQLGYVKQTSKRLARVIFYSMLRHNVGLEHKQALVARIADIGIDLFVITASSLYAATIPGSTKLAQQVFNDARLRIDKSFWDIQHSPDAATTALGLDVLSGQYNWLLAWGRRGD